MNSSEKLAQILYTRLNGDFPESDVRQFVSELKGNGVEVWLYSFQDFVEVSRAPQDPKEVKKILQGNYSTLYRELLPPLSRGINLEAFRDFTLYFIQDALHFEQYVFANNQKYRRHPGDSFLAYQGLLNPPFETNNDTIGYLVYDPETISGVSISRKGNDITYGTHAWLQNEHTLIEMHPFHHEVSVPLHVASSISVSYESSMHNKPKTSAAVTLSRDLHSREFTASQPVWYQE